MKLMDCNWWITRLNPLSSSLSVQNGLDSWLSTIPWKCRLLIASLRGPNEIQSWSEIVQKCAWSICKSMNWHKSSGFEIQEFVFSWKFANVLDFKS